MEVDSLQQRLLQIEQQQMGSQSAPAMSTPVTDSGTLGSDSSVPAPETLLLLTAKLAAVNPARQNPKLISQALSAMPLALKLFGPKDAVALLNRSSGSLWTRIRLSSNPLSQTWLTGQVIGAANCFLDIWLAAMRIDLGEKSEYLDHLYQMCCSSVADLQLFHDGLVLDLWRDDSFDIVGRKTTYFVNRSLIFLTAVPSEE